MIKIIRGHISQYQEHYPRMLTHMKRIKILLLVLCYSCSVYAQGIRGVDFREDYSSAVELAKAEDKMLFVYFYIPECEPCDQLAIHFDNRSIGRFYNDNFISFALDANDEGKKLADSYGVNSFPTILYMTPKGKVKYSARGHRDGESIFEIGKLVSLSARKIRKSMSNKHKENPTDIEHLYDYIEYLYVTKKYLKAEKMLKVYFDQRDSIDSASWMALVLDYGSDPLSCANEVLIEEKDAFIKEYGAGYINGIIWNSLITRVDQKYSGSRVSIFERKLIKEVVDAGYDPEDDAFILFCSEYFLLSNALRTTGMPSADMAVYTQYALKALDVNDHIFDRDHLTDLSIHILSFHQKEEGLTKLSEVLERNFAIDPYYHYLDLQSVALYLLDKEDEAIQKIVEARELALSQGDVQFKPSINTFKKLGIVK